MNVAHAATLATVLRVQALVTDRLARASVTDQLVRASVIARHVLVEDLVVEASASSVDPDQVAAAHVDQRSSVPSADSKNILSNTFRQDVFP